MSRILSLFVLALVLAPSWAQETATLVSEARALLDRNDYAAADAKLAQIPAADARTAADTYADFGVTEYNRRNFRNAYAAFRSALKLQATNQTATQYYLRMRREMDVNNLRNEYVPPAVATPADNTATTATTSTTSASTETATPPPNAATTTATNTTTTQPATPQTPQERSEDLQIVLAQLKAAEDRLNSAQTSVSSSQRENATLRQQLESQRQLVERMLANQRNTPTTVVANPTDNEQLAKTIELLSELAARPNATASDPTISNLLNELSEERRESANPFSSRNLLLTVVLIVVGVGMLALIVIFILAVTRSKRSPAMAGEPYRGSYGIMPVGLDAPNMGFLPAPGSGALQEYSGNTDGRPNDIELSRSLMRADHLQKMYEDVRRGNLSWETVRTYIDDLETSLRADILRVVETKLDSGALLTGEAALPVLFPFLTDFDDYLSDKAEELAKKAILTARTSRGSAEEDNLFSIAALTAIPKKLAEVTQGKDRSMVTAQLAFGIAKKVGLSKTESEGIYKGALAHDAGYLMLDAAKLQRIVAKEEISEEDWKYIQSHVAKGIEYFGGAVVPEGIRDAILFHHERNDGSGYPKGLSKEEIPVAGKIVGVAETFATLISPRSYRDRQEVGHALAIIRDGSRRKFDTDLVNALEEVVKANGGTV